MLDEFRILLKQQVGDVGLADWMGMRFQIVMRSTVFLVIRFCLRSYKRVVLGSLWPARY